MPGVERDVAARDDLALEAHAGLLDSRLERRVGHLPGRRQIPLRDPLDVDGVQELPLLIRELAQERGKATRERVLVGLALLGERLVRERFQLRRALLARYTSLMVV